MQLGLQLEATSSDGAFVHELAEWRPTWNAQRTLLLTTRIEGSCEGPFHLLFPEELGWELVKAVSQPEAALAPEGMDATQLEVFKEMMNLLCGSYNSLFGHLNRALRVSQAEGDLCIHALPANATLEGDLEHVDRGLAISCTMAQAERSFEILQLMPIPLARAIAQHLTLDPQGAR